MGSGRRYGEWEEAWEGGGGMGSFLGYAHIDIYTVYTNKNNIQRKTQFNQHNKDTSKSSISIIWTVSTKFFTLFINLILYTLNHKVKFRYSGSKLSLMQRVALCYIALLS